MQPNENPFALWQRQFLKKIALAGNPHIMLVAETTFSTGEENEMLAGNLFRPVGLLPIEWMWSRKSRRGSGSW
jgi:hypothetical protein